jgi:hypothetical protein
MSENSNEQQMVGLLTIMAPDQQVQRVALTRQTTVVGSSSECDVVVGDSSVATHHFEVVRQGLRYLLVPRALPMWVNGGLAINCHLYEHDLITLGRTAVSFSFVEATLSGEPVQRADTGQDVEWPTFSEVRMQTSPTRSPTSASEETIVSLVTARDSYLKGYVEQVVARMKGNRQAAARALGVSPRTVYRYLEEL